LAKVVTMRGPPPTPVRLKLLKGNPGKRALKRGVEPEPLPEMPYPPPFVTGYAADEWHRVAAALCVLRMLTPLDHMPLAAYCLAYSHWRQAEEELATMRDAEHGLLVKTAQGDVKPNPLVRIAADAARDMLRYAEQFGFSPAARARILAGPFEPHGGKFGDLLA
jgi:P27 family predicted phage terminase small subunit